MRVIYWFTMTFLITALSGCFHPLTVDKSVMSAAKSYRPAQFVESGTPVLLSIPESDTHKAFTIERKGGAYEYIHYDSTAEGLREGSALISKVYRFSDWPNGVYAAAETKGSKLKLYPFYYFSGQNKKRGVLPLEGSSSAPKSRAELKSAIMLRHKTDLQTLTQTQLAAKAYWPKTGSSAQAIKLQYESVYNALLGLNESAQTLAKQ